jgi:hypothetical protein
MTLQVLESPVPVPLVAIVLPMLVALVFLRVRAARAARTSRERKVRSAPSGRATANLPADPAAALEALKAGGSSHG